MTHTPTLPPTDRVMWRRLKARAHPDAGGDHELFVWTGSLEELVCAGDLRCGCGPESRPRSWTGPHHRPPSGEPVRIAYPPETDFRDATSRALRRAASNPDAYGLLLALLEDCQPLDHLWRQQQRGASYKQLAAIGHIVGMTTGERTGWYRVAESIPLSDRHAGHILSRLKGRAA